MHTIDNRTKESQNKAEGNKVITKYEQRNILMYQFWHSLLSIIFILENKVELGRYNKHN